MANTVLEVTGGEAKAAMGKVRLQYTAVTESGAYTASETLRKIIFTFNNPQGMARNYEFNGQKT